jgi:hypothetical protein
MARHAGFASVLSFTEALANAALDLIPVPVQTLDLPVTVGGAVITIQGQWQPFASVSFRQRSDGLVTTELGITGQAVLSAGPLAQYVEFILSATLDVPLNIVVQNDLVEAVIDISQITVLHMNASFSGGPPIVSNPPAAALQNALASPAVAAEATSIIRQLAPLTITLPLISASLNKTVSVGPPPPPELATGGIPNYFTIAVFVGNPVLAQFDGAVTIAFDLEAGFPGPYSHPITSGDPAQLVDLTTVFSPLTIYWELVEGQPQWTTVFGSSMAGPPPPQVNCVALLNPVVVSYLLANNVSPGLSAAPLIQKRLRITSVSANMGWFVPPVPYAPGFGLTVTADIKAYSQTLPDIDGYYYPDPEGVSFHAATVVVYLQELLYELAQGANYQNDTWTMQLVNATVALPAWLVIAVFIPLVLLAAISPVMLTISIVLGAVLGVAVETLGQALTNLMSSGPIASSGLEALTNLDIPFVQQGVNLGDGISADITTWKLGFSEEGAEAQLALSVGTTNPVGELPLWGAWLVPSASFVPFGSYGPLPPGSYSYTIRYDQTSITFDAVVSPPAANPLIVWSVTRPDTGALLLSQSSHYLDPGGGSLSFSRTDPAIQAPDLLRVSAEIVGPGGSVSYTFDFQVIDWLDRTHRYVRWVSHTWFRDPLKPKEWRYYWQRTRSSVLHRTDYPGRCRRLIPGDLLDLFLQVYPDVQAGSLNMADPFLPEPLAKFPWIANLLPEAWQYVDQFPFSSVAAAEAGRRGVLCDYCFFGGPTKSQLLVPVP